MKAAVLHGQHDLRVEEVAPTPLESGEVRLNIEAALTCGTDLKVYNRGYHAKMIRPPAVLGHEMAGVIGEVASDVPNWREGDRAVVANSAPCGGCFFCRAEQPNLCDDLLFLNGAYGESVVIPNRLVQKNLLRLRAETACRDAALTEPLACVVLGAREAAMEKAERVLVIGSGPIGLMFARLAHHWGAHVSVAGRGKARLEVAKRLGATNVISVPKDIDLQRAVMPASPRAGWDLVIEAVGKPRTWEGAVKLVRKGGTVNLFGGCPSGTSVSLDTSSLHYCSLRICSSFHHTPTTVREALALIEAGVIRADDFVDGECSLDRLPQLFQEMTAGNRAVKTCVTR